MLRAASIHLGIHSFKFHNIVFRNVNPLLIGAVFFLGAADKIDSAYTMKRILSQAHHPVCPKP